MKTIALIILVSCLQLRAAIPSMEDLTNVVTALILQGQAVQVTNYTYYTQTQYTFLTITNYVSQTNLSITNTTQVYVTNNILNITNQSVVTNITYFFTNQASFAVSNLPPTIQAVKQVISTPTNRVVISWSNPFVSTNYSVTMSFANSTNAAPPLVNYSTRTTTSLIGFFYDCSGNNKNWNGTVSALGVLNTQ